MLGIAFIMTAIISFSIYLTIMKLFIFKKTIPPTQKDVIMIDKPSNLEIIVTNSSEEEIIEEKSNSLEKETSEAPYPSLHILFWINAYGSIPMGIMSIIIYCINKNSFQFGLNSFFPLIYSSIIGIFHL
jgi:hypothetical protein